MGDQIVGSRSERVREERTGIGGAFAGAETSYSGTFLESVRW